MVWKQNLKFENFDFFRYFSDFLGSAIFQILPANFWQDRLWDFFDLEKPGRGRGAPSRLESLQKLARTSTNHSEAAQEEQEWTEPTNTEPAKKSTQNIQNHTKSSIISLAASLSVKTRFSPNYVDLSGMST